MTSLIGSEYASEAMKNVLIRVQQAIRSDGTVLLLGESGCGKGFLARIIHEHSRNRRGPFFALNCARISQHTAESELFGHEPGAFTGAEKRKRGLLELAEGGTLLLDEIGDLEQALQAHLLTFLDTRFFTRLGGDKQIRIRARVMATTNQDLWNNVRHGRFRRDLYFRLGAIIITIPPLRERKEDIPGLAQHVLGQLAEEQWLPQAPSLSLEALSVLRGYEWPGNVRELRNILESALLLCEVGPIRREHIFLYGPTTQDSIVEPVSALNDRRPLSGDCSINEERPPIIQELLRRTGGRRVRNPSWDARKRLVEECIKERSWTQADIAKALGVGPSTVSKWFKGLAPPS